MQAYLWNALLVIYIGDDCANKKSWSRLKNEEIDEISIPPVTLNTTENNTTELAGKITIVNACNRNKVANELGFYFSKYYGFRYAALNTRDKRYTSTIYYKNESWRDFANKIAKKMPGNPRVEVLPNDSNIKKFNDIVIFLGNDSANIRPWVFD